MKLYQTPTEKKRQREHSKIFRLYCKLQDSTDLSNNQIYCHIAFKLGYSVSGVRKVVTRIKTERQCAMDG